jgi:hypothetical protein
MGYSTWTLKSVRRTLMMLAPDEEINALNAM